MNSESFKLKINTFEGPFPLLLTLIEERKLFINDFSLAQVAEEYLRFLDNLPTKKKEEIIEFISVASALILIKSKSLLPNLVLTDDEKKDIFDLENRLKLYETFLKLSENVKKIFGKRIAFFALEKKIDFAVFLPDRNITLQNMSLFAKEVLDRVPKKIFLPEVEVKKVISMEEMITDLTDRIQNSIEISFREFSGEPKTKEEKVFVIISFLAMLELVRQGIVSVVQDDNFENILIKKQTVAID